MIIDSSRYWEVFDAYRQRFSESAIRVVWFEEYVANPVGVFRDVCGFLGVDPIIEPDLADERRNGRDSASLRMAEIGRSGISISMEWDQAIRGMVIDQLRQDNQRFLDYFGKPRNYWTGLAY